MPSQKKLAISAFARRANQRLHVVQIALQSTPACCRQPVLRLGQPSIKGFRADDVIRFFEFASMDAQIAVRSLKQGLELVESQGAVHCESANYPKADAFVNQPVQVRRNSLSRRSADGGQRRLTLASALDPFLMC